jgi:hypothetical protein
MTIAIDFDDTFTRDPDLWSRFVVMCQNRGYKPIMVTMRFPTQHGGMEDAIELFGAVNVYFTGHHLKKPFMELHNIHVDVWIDDTPESIPNLVEVNGIFV